MKSTNSLPAAQAGANENKNNAQSAGGHPCDGCVFKNECGDCCGPTKLWVPRGSDWQIPALHIDPAITIRLEREFNFLLHAAKPHTDEEWIIAARIAAATMEAFCPDLPGHLGQVAALGGPVAALVTNLPVGTGHADWELARLVCLACASFAGQSFEYLQQAGSLLSKLTTATGLGAHCDDGFLPLRARAELIGLFCAVNQTDAITTATPVALAADALDEADSDILHDSREPRFRLQGPPGVKLGGRELWSEPTPVLFSEEGGPTTARLTIRRGCRATRAGDLEAEGALNRLFAQFENPQFKRSVHLQSGMFLLVSNLCAVHSRIAATRPAERLLFRSLIRDELSSLGSPIQPGSRVFNVWNALAAG